MKNFPCSTCGSPADLRLEPATAILRHNGINAVMIKRFVIIGPNRYLCF